jgi:fumarate reductase subunit D
MSVVHLLGPNQLVSLPLVWLLLVAVEVVLPVIVPVVLQVVAAILDHTLLPMVEVREGLAGVVREVVER